MTLARLVAAGLGCGRASVAPGTVASAATLVPAGLLLWSAPGLLPFSVLATAAAGLWAIRAAQVEGDPGWVVIDEVSGQLLAACGLARATLPGLLVAFVIFRLLDIAKPGPIAWADRQGGAAGIMADDLIAGGIAAGIVWALRSRWPHLFG